MYLNKFFESKTGKYLLSIILGLGLASLFRRVCKDKNCIIMKAPPMKEIQDSIFKYDNKCFQYKTEATTCDANKKIIDM
jgi:hypothetical protein